MHNSIIYIDGLTDHRKSICDELSSINFTIIDNKKPENKKPEFLLNYWSELILDIVNNEATKSPVVLVNNWLPEDANYHPHVSPLNRMASRFGLTPIKTSVNMTKWEIFSKAQQRAYYTPEWAYNSDYGWVGAYSPISIFVGDSFAPIDKSTRYPYPYHSVSTFNDFFNRAIFLARVEELETSIVNMSDGGGIEYLTRLLENPISSIANIVILGQRNEEPFYSHFPKINQRNIRITTIEHPQVVRQKMPQTLGSYSEEIMYAVFPAILT